MGMIGLLLRVTQNELNDYLNDSSLLESRISTDETDDLKMIDIDKSWDGIIYLLTGESFTTSEHPLRKVMFSAQLIDESQDLGYGPAHYNTPEQVANLSAEMEKITNADLRLKYNPTEMTTLEVYPSVWDEDEETFTYLADNFESIKAIYAEAAKNGEAIITVIS